MCSKTRVTSHVRFFLCTVCMLFVLQTEAISQSTTQKHASPCTGIKNYKRLIECLAAAGQAGNFPNVPWKPSGPTGGGVGADGTANQIHPSVDDVEGETDQNQPDTRKFWDGGAGGGTGGGGWG